MTTSKINIRYKSLDELFDRRDYILNELQNKLNEKGNEDYIKDINITIGENSYSLEITLEKV